MTVNTEMETKEQVQVSSTSDYDEDDNGWQGIGFGSRVRYVLRNITVEPLLALFQVSGVLSSLTTQNLNLQKACRVNLQLGDDVCYGLQNKNTSFYAHQEVQVQQQVANMLIWQTVIQSSIPCVLVIFIGSWSDRNRKRKPCMLVPIVGELVTNAGLLLCVFYFDELRMEVAGLVESVPKSMAGGLTVLYLAAFSYMGDISSMKNRTLRVGLMNLFFGAAWPIGAALSGVLFQQLGFSGVYYISTALYMIALIYGIVNIKEHLEPSQLKEPVQQTSRSFMYLVEDFFSLKHIKEAFYTTFKKGPRRRLTKIILLMFTIVAIQGPSQGESGIAYLYTRLRFNWNEMDYSIFSTLLFMTNIVGVGFSIGVLSHLLKVDDALIGIIACVSKVMTGLVFAFAPSEFFFYIGAVVDLMSGSTYIVMRSILSKVVPHDELGQVSAIIAVIETIVPVIYKPLYSAVYKATVNTFPGTVYVIGSIMLTPSIFIYWWMYYINKKDEKKITGEEINSSHVQSLEKY